MLLLATEQMLSGTQCHWVLVVQLGTWDVSGGVWPQPSWPGPLPPFLRHHKTRSGGQTGTELGQNLPLPHVTNFGDDFMAYIALFCKLGDYRLGCACMLPPTSTRDFWLWWGSGSMRTFSWRDLRGLYVVVYILIILLSCCLVMLVVVVSDLFLRTGASKSKFMSTKVDQLAEKIIIAAGLIKFPN